MTSFNGLAPTRIRLLPDQQNSECLSVLKDSFKTDKDSEQKLRGSSAHVDEARPLNDVMPADEGYNTSSADEVHPYVETPPNEGSSFNKDAHDSWNSTKPSDDPFRP